MKEIVMYYVLARHRVQFTQWVKEKGKKMAECKFLENVMDMTEADFKLTSRELVVIVGWAEGRKRDEIDAGRGVINRYCRDRSVTEDKIQKDYVV